MVDLFHEGGTFALIRHVFKIAVMMACPGSSLFHAEYWRRLGPGAELAFDRFSVFKTSSGVMGASRRSVGVTSSHS